MKIEPGRELLPGWRLEIREVSNSVYNVQLRDAHGRISETTSTDIDEACITCANYAFDIERQISRNWSKFLYELCLLELRDVMLRHEANTPGWTVQTTRKKISLVSGAESLKIELHDDGRMIDEQAHATRDITYAAFVHLIT